MKKSGLRNFPSEVRKIEIMATYLIYGKNTRLPYMDKKRTAYLFFKKEDALEFCSEKEQFVFCKNEGEKVNVLELFETLYQYGFKQIIIKSYKENIIPILTIYNNEKADRLIPHVFKYNPILSAAMLFSLQQNQVISGKKIYERDIIIPCKITEKSISYAGAKNHEGIQMCPVFSDLKYFKQWNKWEWSPVVFKISDFMNIMKGKDIVINPATSFSLTLKGKRLKDEI